MSNILDLIGGRVEKKKKRKRKAVAREMTQQLQAFATFPEDLVQFPAPTWQFTTVSNPLLVD